MAKRRGGRSSAPVESVDEAAAPAAVPDPAPGAVVAAEGIPESPAPLSPAPPGDLAAVLPDVGGVEPANIEAAIAALEPPAAPAAEAPATGPDHPRERAPAPVGAPGAALPDRWSRNRIRRAKRTELARKVEELQAQLARVAPPSGSAAAAVAPAVPPGEELREQLELVLPGASAMLEHFAGPAMKLEADEIRILAKTWAPVGAPKYEQLRGRLPLIPAVLTTLGIMAPKLFELMRQAAAQKHGATVKDGPAPLAAPADVVTSAPFGGPSE